MSRSLGSFLEVKMVEPKMKGELGDIRTQLQNIMRAGNKPEVQGKRREVFRRMINYMRCEALEGYRSELRNGRSRLRASREGSADR